MTQLPSTVRTIDDQGKHRNFLLVIVEGHATTHILPEAGEVTIGRADSCDVSISHKSISRHHAVITIGETISIKDLGSANGVKVRGQKIAPDTPVRLSINEVFEAGEITLVFQRRAARPLGVVPATVAAGARAMVLEDEAMQNLYILAERIAVGTIPVLLHGETGVGKQVLAETIHKKSPRAKQAFLELNCSAFTETLLESELFGHEKGSFTGASQSKMGLLESASGGTVFLDEIGDMALNLQAKLLRAIENQEILPIGSLKPRPIDVRFVAATHRDLEQLVLGGQFRQDLYFRLNGVTLEIPPLRVRQRELAELARSFIAESARRLGRKRPPTLSVEALAVLQGHSWPGNIRELRNVMDRAVLLCAGDVVTPAELRLESSGQSRMPAPPLQAAEGTGTSNLPIDDAKKQRVVEALLACGGNNSEAAKILGISRRTLGKWLDECGLPRPRKSK